MGDGTGIQWTEATWNPTTGCSKVSPGCAHCYAESVARRFPATHARDGDWRPWTPANATHNVVLHHDRITQPLRWKRPRLVFVDSMSDLFHDEVPDDFIAEVWGAMAAASQHTFQVLTKRPERARQLLTDDGWIGDARAHAAHSLPNHATPLPDDVDAFPAAPNVWLGVSIENRRFVDRADVLRATPAAVRFISAEPLLGPLVYDTDLGMRGDYPGPRVLADEGDPYERCWSDYHEGPELDLTDIDWIIAGGESGPGARPVDIDWVRGLLEEAEGTSTAVFVKQLGTVTAREIGAQGKGGDPDEWPADLRVRQMPAVASTAEAAR